MQKTDDEARTAPALTLRDRLRQFAWLRSLKRRFGLLFSDSTRLHVPHTFPLFEPNSSGSYEARAALTLQTINQIFPFLSSLATDLQGPRPKLQKIEEFPKNDEDREAVMALKVFLDRNGSDKANHHSYHHLYGVILKKREKVSLVFEIGLGTNNTDVVSSMGPSGRPGASLRAFRDFCPNAQIFGADVDRRVLFSEERIRTHYVDQTDPSTFAALQGEIPDGLDMMIDDGLHSPNANAESLRFGLSKVKPGGWVVIEDIAMQAVPFWEVVAALLPPRFQSHLLLSGGSVLFAVQRLT